MPNPRKTDEVKRLLESMQKALKDREKNQGASVEDLAREVNKTKENFEKASKEQKQMTLLNKVCLLCPLTFPCMTWNFLST